MAPPGDLDALSPTELKATAAPLAPEVHAGLIRAALDEVPDLTLPELKAKLAGQGASVSVAALWRFCRRHKITRKKDRARLRAGPPGRPEAARGLVRRPARPRPGAPCV